MTSCRRTQTIRTNASSKAKLNSKKRFWMQTNYRKAIRSNGSIMVRPSSLKIYLQPRVTLTFDPQTRKVDRFMPLSRGPLVPAGSQLHGIQKTTENIHVSDGLRHIVTFLIIALYKYSYLLRPYLLTYLLTYLPTYQWASK